MLLSTTNKVVHSIFIKKDFLLCNPIIPTIMMISLRLLVLYGIRRDNMPSYYLIIKKLYYSILQEIQKGLMGLTVTVVRDYPSYKLEGSGSAVFASL